MREYSYVTTQPVFSQSKTTYHILVPQSVVALKGKSITSIKAYYYNALEDSYILLGTTEPSGINTPEIGVAKGDIFIYSVNGFRIKRIAAGNVAESYGNVLKSLPRGIYVVKEANKARKIAL